jgi:hypothetical protein
VASSIALARRESVAQPRAALLREATQGRTAGPEGETVDAEYRVIE